MAEKKCKHQLAPKQHTNKWFCVLHRLFHSSEVKWCWLLVVEHEAEKGFLSRAFSVMAYFSDFCVLLSKARHITGIIDSWVTFLFFYFLNFFLTLMYVCNKSLKNIGTYFTFQKHYSSCDEWWLCDSYWHYCKRSWLWAWKIPPAKISVCHHVSKHFETCQAKKFAFFDHDWSQECTIFGKNYAKVCRKGQV